MRAKKLYFFILLVVAAQLLVLKGRGQATGNADIIEWRAGRKLQLKDYKVISDSSTQLALPVAALTRTGIVYYLSTDKVGSKALRVRITIQANVHRSHSFLRKRALKMPVERQQRLLNHEQKHFDISEIFAREAARELRMLKLSGKFSQEIRSFVTAKFKAAEAYQHRYDAETRNGEDFEAQQKWDERIAHRLQQLEAYKNKVVVRNL